MKKYLAVILAAVVGCFVLSLGTAMGQGYGQSMPSSKAPTGGSPSADPNAKKPGTIEAGGAIVGTPITKEEAAKKYPLPGGKSYPLGERDNHKPSGWVNSPYAPRQMYDCSKIGHGELVLDTHVNKVFIRP